MRRLSIFDRSASLLAIGLVVSADVGAQQASASTQIVSIRKHTALKFALVQPLDSAAAKIRDDVPIRLDRPSSWMELVCSPPVNWLTARSRK